MSTKKEQLLFHYHDDDKLYTVKQKDGTRWLHTGGREIQSGILLSDPKRLRLNYQIPMIALRGFIKAPPKRILLLGLGGGSIATYLQDRFPESQLFIVDIEPMMLEIAQDYFFFEPSATTQVICADAYDYLKDTEQSFDMIFCDIFGIKSMPEIMRNPTFYKALQQALTPTGLTAINLVCDSHEQFLLYLSWHRHAFTNRTLSHGIAHSRNILFYGFNDPNWGVRFNQLVRHSVLPDPISSEITGAYLDSIPTDFEERLNRMSA